MRLSLFKAGMNVRYVNLNGMNFCYAERGIVGRETTIVFIHGFSSSKEWWLPIIQYMSPETHIVVFDIPGHGSTDVPSELEQVTREGKAIFALPGKKVFIGKKRGKY